MQFLAIASIHSKSVNGASHRGLIEGGVDVPTTEPTVIRSFPHNESCFTEGLVMDPTDTEIMYESCGLYNQSNVRRIRISTGEVIALHTLPNRYFGEGITYVASSAGLGQSGPGQNGPRIYGMTYKAMEGTIYNADDLAPLATWEYATNSKQGWGLTTNQTHLFASDGTSTIYIWDLNATKVGHLEVTADGFPQEQLNELEYIPARGNRPAELMANVLYTGVYNIARISLQTGVIFQWLNFSGVLASMPPLDPSYQVFNGIAYDRATDELYAMGFDPALATKALTQVSGDVQKATELLLAGSITTGSEGGGGGRKLGDSSALSPGTGKGMDDTDDNAVTESTESGTAHSLQCDECGKKLRDATAAQHHAERTQHTQFSESTDVIKPLSAEEKAEKLKLIQERLAAKRAAREGEALETSKAKEKLRRAEGQDLVKQKEAFEHRQMMKLAAEKKRERLEAKQHKEKVKALLAQDEAERRAAKVASSAKITSGAANTSGRGAHAAAPAAPKEKKEYTSCRVQFRHSGCTPVTAKFAATDTIGALFAHARDNVAGLEGKVFTLLMTRPRKEYDVDVDGDTSISSTDLMPSAVLIINVK